MNDDVYILNGKQAKLVIEALGQWSCTCEKTSEQIHDQERSDFWRKRAIACDFLRDLIKSALEQT